MTTEIDYPLLPEDDAIPVEQEIATAIASVLEELTPIPGESPEVYGRSWDLDFVAMRFRRQGLSPVAVNGLGSLDVWCEMALRTARFAHSVFTDQFGMANPEDILGHVDIGERVGDYGEWIRETWLVHDRIVDVVDYEGDFDPDTGAMTFTATRVTDDEQRLPFGPLRVEIGA